MAFNSPGSGTWAKRIEITVSNTNIDSDLDHFPLLLTLGTSVGTGSEDVSAIFDMFDSGGSDIARDKDQMIADAITKVRGI